MEMEGFFDRGPKGKGSEVPRPPTPQAPQQKQEKQQQEDEIDPLDAFMAGLSETLVRERAELEEKIRKEQAGEALVTHKERFFDDDDIAAESIEHLNTQKTLAQQAESARGKRKAPLLGNCAETDDEGDVRGRVLPVVNHAEISYPPYTADIYEEHPDVTALSLEAVGEVRDSLQLHTTGKQVPRPVASFVHLKSSLPKGLWSALQRKDYRLPTAVQAAVIPALLKGRDCLAMAQTGSGKTAAYLVPLLTRVQHLKATEHWGIRQVTSQHAGKNNVGKKELKAGPSAIIVCPTRELAVQVDGEIHSFTRGGADLDISRLLLAGGFDKTEQFKTLRRGPDVVVCNPGRVIDICSLKGLDGIFDKVVMAVVDEADKMVQMGFEAQLREVLFSLRPDRITAMFSATMPRKCEALANQFLRNPIRVVVGEAGQAAQSVTQRVQIVDGEAAKLDWLCTNLLSLLASSQDPEQQQQQQQEHSARAATAAATAGGVIFCSSQQRVEDLAFLLDTALSQEVRATRGSPAGMQNQGLADVASRAAAARLLKGDNAQDLKKNANQTFNYVAILHGGMQQGERLAVMRRVQHHFLGGPDSPKTPLVLVATDVAARGLDFPPAFSLVVCYDAPTNPQVYVHRIGRAGRAGRSGLACSIFTKQEKRQAAFVVEKMEASGQKVPHSLMQFAMQFQPFKEARLSGLRVVWQGGKAGRELRYQQQNASFGGLGFDTGCQVEGLGSIVNSGVPSLAEAAAAAAAASAAAAAAGAAVRPADTDPAIPGAGDASLADGSISPPSGGSGNKRGRWDSKEQSSSSNSNTSDGRAAPVASGDGRRATLNLAKREQRRQQWLSTLEARRDQRQQQVQQQRHKGRHDRSLSPPRRSFQERPRQISPPPQTEEARAAALRAHEAAWRLEANASSSLHSSNAGLSLGDGHSRYAR